jgi:hypothetical protein
MITGSGPSSDTISDPSIVLAGGKSTLFQEESVVILGRVEGRTEIDEINGFAVQVTPEDVEVVAVIKRAHERSVRGKIGGVNSRRQVVATR